MSDWAPVVAGSVWLVYQTVTLYVGSKLLRLIARWRAARRLGRSM
jgi:hypothetical protein